MAEDSKAIQRHFENGDELCKYVRENFGDTVLLSFSTGKDSIGAWLQLRKYFSDIIPYYMFTHPDIKFINDYLSYCEDWFGVRIIRVPHPSIYRFWCNFVFQPPDRIEKIYDLGIKQFDYDDINAVIKFELGLDDNVYQANGVCARDSLNRWSSFKKWGSLNPNRKTFSPIYDWKKARMVQEFRNAKVKLPVDYRLFGRSLDGLDCRFMEPLRNAYPEDYDRAMEIAPFADMDLYRMRFRKEYHEREKHG